MYRTIEDIAEQAYGAYDREAKQKTFDGRPLPTWQELGVERQRCWVAAIERALDYERYGK